MEKRTVFIFLLIFMPSIYAIFMVGSVIAPPVVMVFFLLSQGIGGLFNPFMLFVFAQIGFYIVMAKGISSFISRITIESNNEAPKIIVGILGIFLFVLSFFPIYGLNIKRESLYAFLF